jgi:hypothetical protein
MTKDEKKISNPTPGSYLFNAWDAQGLKDPFTHVAGAGSVQDVHYKSIIFNNYSISATLKS